LDKEVKIPADTFSHKEERAPLLNAATKSGSGPLVSADDVSMASTSLQGSQSSLPSAGHAFPSAGHEPVPQIPAGHEPVPQIEGYKFDKKIGAGGQGTVWLARGQSDPDTKVAIKICRNSNGRERAEREIENLDALSRLQHPNIVQYIDFRKRECALIMKYVPGKPLSAHLQDDSGGKRSLTWDEASVIMLGILSGLKCLHTMQSGSMLHRDVKPENVMLSSTPVTDVPHVILVDFGLSKRMNVGQTVTMGERMIGTPAYLSPEVLKGMPSRDLDARVDVWAAGVVLYEMLAGKLPFSGDSTLALIESIKNDDVDRIGAAGSGGNAFLKKSLEKNRENRFQNASDMLEVFNIVYEDHHSVPEQLKSHTEPTPQPAPPTLAEPEFNDDSVAIETRESTKDEAREEVPAARGLQPESKPESSATLLLAPRASTRRHEARHDARDPHQCDPFIRSSCNGCDVCKARRTVTAFGIGIDIDDEECARTNQNQRSKDFGIGVKRIESLRERLSIASFDLKQDNCDFQLNPNDRQGLLDAIEKWEKGVESSGIIPDLVLFLISTHELKADNGYLFLLPSGKTSSSKCIDDGVALDSILRSLSGLERKLKSKASKDVLFVVIIETMTGPEPPKSTLGASELDSSKIVLINAKPPTFGIHARTHARQHARTHASVYAQRYACSCTHALAHTHTCALPLSHARTHSHIHPFQQPCDGHMHISFKKTHTSIHGTENVFKSESDNTSGLSFSSRLAACLRLYMWVNIHNYVHIHEW